MPQKPMTVHEVAEFLGVKPVTIYRMVKSKRLSAYRIRQSNALRFKPQDVNKALEKNKKKTSRKECSLTASAGQ